MRTGYVPHSADTFSTWQTSAVVVGAHSRHEAAHTKRSKVVPPVSQTPFPAKGAWATSECTDQFKAKVPRALSAIRYRHLIHPLTPPVPTQHGDRRAWDNKIWQSTNDEFQASVSSRKMSAKVIARKVGCGCPRNESAVLETGPVEPRPVSFPRYSNYSSNYKRADAIKDRTASSLNPWANTAISNNTSTREQFPAHESCRREPILPSRFDSKPLNAGKTDKRWLRTTATSAFGPRTFTAPPHIMMPRDTPGDAGIIPHQSTLSASETTSNTEFGQKHVIAYHVRGPKTTVEIKHHGETAVDPFCSTQKVAQLQTLNKRAAPFDKRFIANLKRSHIIFPVS